MKHVFRFIGKKSVQGWVLAESEMYHAIKVVQLQVDDVFEVADGNGLVARARVVERTKKDFVFEIIGEQIFAPNLRQIDLLCAALKPGVMDDVLPGSVELGVRKIVVFAQDRGEAKRLNDKVQARWQRIIDEAFKQSKRAYNAEMHICENFEQALKVTGQYQMKLMLDETESATSPEMPAEGSIALLVGSESGLTSATRESALAHGFKGVTISRNILRSRTAITAGLAIFSYMLL